MQKLFFSFKTGVIVCNLCFAITHQNRFIKNEVIIPTVVVASCLYLTLELSVITFLLRNFRAILDVIESSQIRRGAVHIIKND